MEKCVLRDVSNDRCLEKADGIDETSNASFTDVVKEVVSDITGKSFENMDDPINDDDDDDPIKFK